MSDSYHSITIVFEKDISNEYAERVRNFCALLGGVISVTPNMVDVNTDLATLRARWELETKLLKMVREEK